MHRPFTDNAGYTRHCWECKHAHQWTAYNDAWCETGLERYGASFMVSKTDSPNNPIGGASGCTAYEALVEVKDD